MNRTSITAAALAVAALSLTACGGSSNSNDRAGLKACVAALDEANRGFIHLGDQIGVMKNVMDQAFSGDINGANATLATMPPNIDPSTYHALEAKCRAAAR